MAHFRSHHDWRRSVKTVLQATQAEDNICVRGWARTVRNGKEVTFIALNDGTCLDSLQVVAGAGLENFDAVARLGTGACLVAVGRLVDSPAEGQQWELQAESIQIIGGADQEFPLQKKRHGFEYLRTIGHLRPRSNSFGAVFRVRSALSFAVHAFFRERGFLYVLTPIITASDCEGTGD